MKTLKDFSDDELDAFLREEHCNKRISLRELARRLDTNAVRLLRFCNKRNIPVLSKSESLRAGYESERLNPHMKGKTWSEEHKRDLGKKQHEAWNNLSEEERKRRSEIQRENFENMPNKEEFRRKGALAIREASINGSKAEHALAKMFDENGIRYIHHYKSLLPGTKLEVDFYLPEYNCVVEIDGPSHFATNLGIDNYRSQMQADEKKNGLVLGLGASIIRLQHRRTLYKRDHYNMFEVLKNVLPTLSNELRIIDVERI